MTSDRALMTRDVRDRLATFGMVPEKVLFRKGNAIAVLTPLDANRIINLWVRRPDIAPEVMAISKGTAQVRTSHGPVDVPSWTVIDNTYGDCWVEEFYREGSAFRWLLGEYEDIDDLVKADLRYGEKLASML